MGSPPTTTAVAAGNWSMSNWPMATSTTTFSAAWGSVVGLTDPSGTQLVDTYSYDPTGNILTQTGTVPNNWQYAGGYFNQNTGLTKFGTRYYDPTLGGWPQQDPVAGSLDNPDSLNRYLYAKDNPVNFTDPSGRFTYVGAVIFAIISAISSGVAILGANIVLLEALLAEAALAGPAILLIAAVLIGLLAAIAATDAITTACYGSSFL